MEPLRSLALSFVALALCAAPLHADDDAPLTRGDLDRLLRRLDQLEQQVQDQAAEIQRLRAAPAPPPAAGPARPPAPTPRPSANVPVEPRTPESAGPLPPPAHPHLVRV